MADFGGGFSAMRGALLGVNTATTLPTTLTSPAGSVNTKAAWVELVAGTPFDSAMLIVHVRQSGTGGNHSIRVDIGIGASGAETVLVGDIVYGRPSSSNLSFYKALPLSVPAGTRLSARYQHSFNSSGTVAVGVYLLPSTFGGAAYSRCATVGHAAASDYGVVVDPGATANTKSAWYELSASIPFDVQCIVPNLTQSAGRTATGDVLLDLGIGAPGSEVVVLPDFPVEWGPSSGTQVMPNMISFPLPMQLRAGDRLAVRSQNSITTATARNTCVSLFLLG